MDKRIIKEAVAVILALAIFAIWYFGGGSTNVFNKNTSTGVLEVKNVELHDSNAYAKIDGAYPEFTGSASVINEPIKNLLTNAIAEHKKESEENWKARVETATEGQKINKTPLESEKFDFTVSYEVSALSEAYVSVLVRYYSFVGGAHGKEILTSFNYDLKNQKEITLQDLFGNDYLKTISDASIKKLKEQIPGAMRVGLSEDIEDQILEGAGQKSENFRTFTFTEGAVVRIYFAEYQVGPYAIGIQTVDIPLK